MNTHHAYLYEGSPVILPELAEAARTLFGFNIAHDPDVRVRAWDKFGIDESLELGRLASLRSTAGRALFILGIAAISHPAQQALLKLFEEPQEGTVFVLLVPHGILLDTVRSRLVEFPPFSPRLNFVANEVMVKPFLAASYKKRSEMIAAMLKDEDGARDRTRQFLNDLEAALYKLPAATLGRIDGLTDIANFRVYLSDTAPSLKMILEHFAATLPQV